MSTTTRAYCGEPLETDSELERHLAVCERCALVLRHSNRFRTVSNGYPRAVAEAYDRDIARADADTDEVVAATVAAYREAHGLPRLDWWALGTEEGRHPHREAHYPAPIGIVEPDRCQLCGVEDPGHSYWIGIDQPCPRYLELAGREAKGERVALLSHLHCCVWHFHVHVCDDCGDAGTLWEALGLDPSSPDRCVPLETAERFYHDHGPDDGAAWN